MALQCVGVAIKLDNSQGEHCVLIGLYFHCREKQYAARCNSKTLRKLETLVHCPVKCVKHLQGLAHK